MMVGGIMIELADSNKLDRMRCKQCKKIMCGGVNRLKQHIAGIIGEVSACLNATKEEQNICRNALNEIKIKCRSK